MLPLYQWYHLVQIFICFKYHKGDDFTITKKLKTILSAGLIFAMLTPSMSAFSSTNSINNTTTVRTLNVFNINELILSKDYALQNYINLSSEAKKMFLNEIQNDSELLEFHKKYIDPSCNLEKRSRVKRDAGALNQIRTGLQALNLPGPVYYSLVSFASGLAAAVADGPLPVGDIVALGGGIVTGLAIAWYWDEIESKLDDIYDVFKTGFSTMSSNVERALDELFYKAQPKKPTGRKVKEVKERLKKEGFQKTGQTGSHEKWKKGDKTVTVPNHGDNVDIPTGTLRNIWKQAGWI